MAALGLICLYCLEKGRMIFYSIEVYRLQYVLALNMYLVVLLYKQLERNKIACFSELTQKAILFTEIVFTFSVEANFEVISLKNNKLVRVN